LSSVNCAALGSRLFQESVDVTADFRDIRARQPLVIANQAKPEESEQETGHLALVPQSGPLVQLLRTRFRIQKIRILMKMIRLPIRMAI
jgi:hypothetical protein